MRIQIKKKYESNKIYVIHWFVIENGEIIFRDKDTGNVTAISLEEIVKIENG